MELESCELAIRGSLEYKADDPETDAHQVEEVQR
jgi:hypothetical protein